MFNRITIYNIYNNNIYNSNDKFTNSSNVDKQSKVYPIQNSLNSSIPPFI